GHVRDDVLNAEVPEDVPVRIELTGCRPRTDRISCAIRAGEPRCGETECKDEDIHLFERCTHGGKMLLVVGFKFRQAAETSWLDLGPERIEVASLMRPERLLGLESAICALKEL